MQCKFPKYSCDGRTLENATVFPDRGFDGHNQAISTVYALQVKAKTSMAKAASTEKWQLFIQGTHYAHPPFATSP
jgi:hypothetical protein